MITTHDALRTVSDILSSGHISEPQAKARVMVHHVLGESFSDITAPVQGKAWSSIMAFADRARLGEPVEYITGRAYFRYLELNVSPCVLIPRKETELVAGRAIDIVREKHYKSALDMCTGSGCIAISLATETDANVHAADISCDAIKVAKTNAEKNGADVSFFVSDMFDSVCSTYDIIVCNPPYISEQDYEKLDESVKKFEPELALKSVDGLDQYRIIASMAGKYLNDGGVLVLEIGADQGNSAADMLEQSGFKNVECSKDYQDRDRIVTAYK